MAKSKMTAATKRKLAAYKKGKVKPMSKRARAAAARKRIAKLDRYPKGHAKAGQIKPKRLQGRK